MKSDDQAGPDRPPGPVALAAFAYALEQAGPAGLDSAAVALVHVPGLVRVSAAYRLACLALLRARGRCVVDFVACAPPCRPGSVRPIYRHAMHAGPTGAPASCGAIPAGVSKARKKSGGR